MKINYKTNKINNGILNLEKPFIDEGIVWDTLFNGERYTFKVKGEKHSISKVKTLASVDVEKLETINEFLDYAVTQNRVNQALTEISNSEFNIKRTGDYIRWVYNDIIKEESDVIKENGLSEKELGKGISAKTKTFFRNYF